MGHLDPTQNSQAASEKKLKAYACELEQKLEARARELAEARGDLAEALEQQNATSEILGAVARSSTDVQIVLDTVCQSTARRPRRPPWPDHANRVCSVCPRVSPGPFVSR